VRRTPSNPRRCPRARRAWLSPRRPCPWPPPPDNTIQLGKLSGIKGAKPIMCPDNRLACPGNYGVNIIAKLNNTLEEFQAAAQKWRSNLAAAVSMPVNKVRRAAHRAGPRRGAAAVRPRQPGSNPASVPHTRRAQPRPRARPLCAS
jgi:hypothetical protein